ncbi:NADH-quinone oxidoreductase subunit J [Gorillibacterium massiliense]|uniref:NADH-quinone oxidoreductase subunit J n=1 Tax=Gorillibacterium massiliense TaxID=1280390 RepID=UPI0004B4AD2D|nr:NADH-quinone oxidoreductase subunit J [Gorillibacterium massiliense]
MLNNLVDNLSDASSIFYLIFAVLAIGGGIMMINAEKVVYMVLSIAVTFLSLAGLYIMLEAEFVAFVQVLIYAGAVTILTIFGIALTKTHKAEGDEEGEGEGDQRKPAYIGVVLAACLVLFGILFYAIQKASFPGGTFDPGKDNPLELGKLLFNVHVIPFEIMSVLLTVAFLGAVIIARREEDEQ